MNIFRRASQLPENHTPELNLLVKQTGHYNCPPAEAIARALSSDVHSAAANNQLSGCVAQWSRCLDNWRFNPAPVVLKGEILPFVRDQLAAMLKNDQAWIAVKAAELLSLGSLREDPRLKSAVITRIEKALEESPHYAYQGLIDTFGIDQASLRTPRMQARALDALGQIVATGGEIYLRHAAQLRTAFSLDPVEAERRILSACDCHLKSDRRSGMYIASVVKELEIPEKSIQSPEWQELGTRAAAQVLGAEHPRDGGEELLALFKFNEERKYETIFRVVDKILTERPWDMERSGLWWISKKLDLDKSEAQPVIGKRAVYLAPCFQGLLKLFQIETLKHLSAFAVEQSEYVLFLAKTPDQAPRITREILPGLSDMHISFIEAEQILSKGHNLGKICAKSDWKALWAAMKSDCELWRNSGGTARKGIEAAFQAAGHATVFALLKHGHWRKEEELKALPMLVRLQQISGLSPVDFEKTIGRAMVADFGDPEQSLASSHNRRNLMSLSGLDFFIQSTKELAGLPALVAALESPEMTGHYRPAIEILRKHFPNRSKIFSSWSSLRRFMHHAPRVLETQLIEGVPGHSIYESNGIA